MDNVERFATPAELAEVRRALAWRDRARYGGPVWRARALRAHEKLQTLREYYGLPRSALPAALQG